MQWMSLFNCQYYVQQTHRATTNPMQKCLLTIYKFNTKVFKTKLWLPSVDGRKIHFVSKVLCRGQTNSIIITKINQCVHPSEKAIAPAGSKHSLSSRTWCSGVCGSDRSAPQSGACSTADGHDTYTQDSPHRQLLSAPLHLLHSPLLWKKCQCSINHSISKTF